MNITDFKLYYKERGLKIDLSTTSYTTFSVHNPNNLFVDLTIDSGTTEICYLTFYTGEQGTLGEDPSSYELLTSFKLIPWEINDNVVTFMLTVDMLRPIMESFNDTLSPEKILVHLPNMTKNLYIKINSNNQIEPNNNDEYYKLILSHRAQQIGSEIDNYSIPNKPRRFEPGVQNKPTYTRVSKPTVPDVPVLPTPPTMRTEPSAPLFNNEPSLGNCNTINGQTFTNATLTKPALFDGTIYTDCLFIGDTILSDGNFSFVDCFFDNDGTKYSLTCQNFSTIIKMYNSLVQNQNLMTMSISCTYFKIDNQFNNFFKSIRLHGNTTAYITNQSMFYEINCEDGCKLKYTVPYLTTDIRCHTMTLNSISYAWVNASSIYSILASETSFLNISNLIDTALNLEGDANIISQYNYFSDIYGLGTSIFKSKNDTIMGILTIINNSLLIIDNWSDGYVIPAINASEGSFIQILGVNNVNNNNTITLTDSAYLLITNSILKTPINGGIGTYVTINYSTLNTIIPLCYGNYTKIYESTLGGMFCGGGYSEITNSYIDNNLQIIDNSYVKILNTQILKETSISNNGYIDSSYCYFGGPILATSNTSSVILNNSYLTGNLTLYSYYSNLDNSTLDNINISILRNTTTDLAHHYFSATTFTRTNLTISDTKDVVILDSVITNLTTYVINSNLFIENTSTKSFYNDNLYINNNANVILNNVAFDKYLSSEINCKLVDISALYVDGSTIGEGSISNDINSNTTVKFNSCASRININNIEHLMFNIVESHGLITLSNNDFAKLVSATLFGNIECYGTSYIKLNTVSLFCSSIKLLDTVFADFKYTTSLSPLHIYLGSGNFVLYKSNYEYLTLTTNGIPNIYAEVSNIKYNFINIESIYPNTIFYSNSEITHKDYGKYYNAIYYYSKIFDLIPEHVSYKNLKTYNDKIFNYTDTVIHYCGEEDSVVYIYYFIPQPELSLTFNNPIGGEQFYALDYDDYIFYDSVDNIFFTIE